MGKKEVVIKALLEKTRKVRKDALISLASERRLTSTVDNVVSTGIKSLDLVCAKAGAAQYGLPFGRMIEILGDESTGKTTLLLQLARNVQQLGGLAYWIEMEGALDLKYAKTLGVNLDSFIVSQPDTAEEIFAEIETLCDTVGDMKEKIPVIILWDSVAATATEAEVKGEFGQSHMAPFARFISGAMRKITKSISKNNILFVWTNQKKAKIGISWGRKWASYGEGSLKYYASIRLDLYRAAQIKDKHNNIIGAKTGVKILKNKCMSTQFVELDPVDVIRGEGFIYASGLINALDMRGKIDRSSKGWLGLGNEKYREKELIECISESVKFQTQCEKLLFKTKKKKKKKHKVAKK